MPRFGTPASITLMFALSIPCGSPFTYAANASTDPLDQLSSSDFNDRRKGVQNAESALVSQSTGLLTLDDADTNAEVAKILQFNQRFSSLLLESQKWPAAARIAVLQFLQTPAILPIRAQLFSPVTEERAEGMHGLAKLQAPTVDLLLGYFAHDDSTLVALAAMDGMWDRPSSQFSVDALWEIAIIHDLSNALNANPGVQRPPAPAYTFRGQPLGVRNMLIMNSINLSGGAINHPEAIAALMTLTHFKGPLVETHVTQTLQSLNDRLRVPADQQVVSYGILRVALQALAQLAADCQMHSALPVLYSIATVPLSNRLEMPHLQLNIGGALPYSSVHTDSMAAFLCLTGQDPASYSLARNSQGTWISPSKDDEQKSVDKLEAWWKQNASTLTASQ